MGLLNFRAIDIDKLTSSNDLKLLNKSNKIPGYLGVPRHVRNSCACVPSRPRRRGGHRLESCVGARFPFAWARPWIKGMWSYEETSIIINSLQSTVEWTTKKVIWRSLKNWIKSGIPIGISRYHPHAWKMRSENKRECQLYHIKIGKAILNACSDNLYE